LFWGGEAKISSLLSGEEKISIFPILVFNTGFETLEGVLKISIFPISTFGAGFEGTVERPSVFGGLEKISTPEKSTLVAKGFVVGAVVTELVVEENISISAMASFVGGFAGVVKVEGKRSSDNLGCASLI